MVDPDGQVEGVSQIGVGPRTPRRQVDTFLPGCFLPAATQARGGGATLVLKGYPCTDKRPRGVRRVILKAGELVKGRHMGPQLLSRRTIEAIS